MVKFSIIVPAYNEEKNVARCLDSLVNLDFDKNDYEVILVNNNSTDRTKEIAETFSGVKIIDEPKQGNVFALIKGCLQARGEILVFTDADTIVPKDWLIKINQAYQNEKVVCAGGPGKLRPKTFLGFFGEKLFYWGGALTKLAPCFNLSIRKSVYKEIGGFDPKINFHQDTYLVLKAKKRGKAVFLRDNYVITSSRHFKGWPAIPYILKGGINLIFLFLFGKTIFWDFGNVRGK
ncbi:MAG: glycosyltransferase [Patescibacteria group bacterium]